MSPQPLRSHPEHIHKKPIGMAVVHPLLSRTTMTKRGLGFLDLLWLGVRVLNEDFLFAQNFCLGLFPAIGTNLGLNLQKHFPNASSSFPLGEICPAGQRGELHLVTDSELIGLTLFARPLGLVLLGSVYPGPRKSDAISQGKDAMHSRPVLGTTHQTFLAAMG